MSSTSGRPGWVSRPPSVGSVVTCLYPGDPKARLRPCLVLGVATGSAGGYAIHVAYGTSQLDKDKRGDIDLIIEDAADINACGIALATRFDLENTAAIVWEPPEFDCWHGRYSPVLGSLPRDKQIDCAYKLRAINDKTSS
jgi:hypothetical protein